MGLKRATTTFHHPGGVVVEGELLDEKDDVVKSCPGYFADPEPAPGPVVHRAAPVEQATAAPGEKRAVAPRKRAARKQQTQSDDAGDKG